MELRDFKKEDAKEIEKWIQTKRELALWSMDFYENASDLAEAIYNNYEKCQKKGNFYPKTLIENDKIVGHLILRNPDERKEIIRLGFIIVNSELRGKGYGKRLIQEAIKFARKTLNATEINLIVFENNIEAYECYKSVGFISKSRKENVFQFENESWNCVKMLLED